mgnify:CR=1 FL=1
MLPADSERETIKRMILKYGSLNAALYTDPFIFESEHMEASYCDVPEIANHEVCIVGGMIRTAGTSLKTEPGRNRTERGSSRIPGEPDTIKAGIFIFLMRIKVCAT